MAEIYNADLANELGNLVSRLTNLGETDGLTVNNIAIKQYSNITIEQFNRFQFNIILEEIWQEIKALNKKINDFAPWKKTPDERKAFLIKLLTTLHSIGTQLQPFIPQTADAVTKATTGRIKKTKPLFPKIK